MDLIRLIGFCLKHKGATVAFNYIENAIVALRFYFVDKGDFVWNVAIDTKDPDKITDDWFDYILEEADRKLIQAEKNQEDFNKFMRAFIKSVEKKGENDNDNE